MIYEHLLRYHFVLDAVAGREVIDLGSGEGYGSALLATRASRVLGIDIDPGAVRHSLERYGSEKLDFRTLSVVELDTLPRHSFDVAVCFEVIEHILEQEALVTSVARLLRPGGVFVVSTPDVRVYSGQFGYDNAYHVHEMERDEFKTLLGRHFAHVAIWGQWTAVGSQLLALEESDEARPDVVFVDRVGEEWRPAAHPEPVFLVGVASSRPLPALPIASALMDRELRLAELSPSPPTSLRRLAKARARQRVEALLRRSRPGLLRKVVRAARGLDWRT